MSQNGTAVLSHFDFYIQGTEKIAVVGRNGAGKSTLLSVITGEKELDPDEKHPEAGLFRARKFTVGVLRQQAVKDPSMTVEECILGGLLTDNSGSERKSEGKSASAPSADTGKSEDASEPDHWQGNTDAISLNRLYSKERFEYEQRYDRIFTELGFSLDDKGKRLGEFSGGEQTKIMLIRLLLAEPDVLILDEPTNHLDLDSTMWLEENLKKYPKAVVTVSHDRYFIDQTAEAVWEVSGGKLVRYPGNYTAYRKAKAVRAEKERKAWEAQQAEIARLDELIRKFRGKPRKASFARSREKILERMEKMEQPDTEGAVIHAGDIQPARPGDKWIFQCEDLVIGYRRQPHADDRIGSDENLAESESDDAENEAAGSSQENDREERGTEKTEIRKLSYRLRRGQKIGVFGPNGTGKSTFLKTVAGLIPALSGKMQIGEHVDPAYFDQLTENQMEETANDQAAAEDRGQTIGKSQMVIDWFGARFPQMKPGDIRKYLAGFLFRGDDMGKPVSSLSGGEKARLAIAAILAGHPNFLILDEPTNNMDIPAIEALESMLKEYEGTVLFVSHDRYFLSQVADGMLIFEPGTQEVGYYPSDFAHYMERRKRIESGVDVSIARSAENQKLIEGLRAVPKKETGMLRQIPLAEQQFDWEFDRNREVREPAEQAYAAACEELEDAGGEADIGQWEAECRKRQDQAEAARDRWTEACLGWYDIWLERENERNGADSG